MWPPIRVDQVRHMALLMCNLKCHYTPIISTAPLELLYGNYMSTVMTMELNQSPKVVNILAFQDHSAKHIMVYVTPDQTTKTVTRFLYQGYISTSGAQAMLLSDQGVNFISNITWKLCRLMGIKKIGTSPYHAQTNGQVECTHHTIIQMIGNLAKTGRPIGSPTC